MWTTVLHSGAIILSIPALHWASFLSIPNLINLKGEAKWSAVFSRVREQFLSVQKITTLEALNESLGQWIDSYNNRVHSITKEEPLKRFIRNIECVRPAPKDLEDHFRKAAKRTVAKDRTIAIEGRLV